MSNGQVTIGRARSGRRFVVAAVVVVVALWASIFVAFRAWRERHEALAEYGRRELAAVVDPLADRVPPGVRPEEWRAAVADTRAMLGIAVASGTLDRARIDLLRDDLRDRLARATPETLAPTLGRLWDDLRREVGPVLSGRPSRPPFCPPEPEILKQKTETQMRRR